MARWKGPVTGHLYPMQITGKSITVDLRDVECMMGWKSKSGKPLFKRLSE